MERLKKKVTCFFLVLLNKVKDKIPTIQWNRSEEQGLPYKPFNFK